MSYTSEAAITDTIRSECARVAEHARSVRIHSDLVPAYAAALLPSVESVEANVTRAALSTEERERRAAYWLTLDAINFGSGWFPTLRKRGEPTGYRTIAAGVQRRFSELGPWTAGALSRIGTAEIARTLDQDPDHELMLLFTDHLRDLGRHLASEFKGSFSAVADSTGGSAVALVERLAGWNCFADSSVYSGHVVPFLKRAQIAAADLDRADAVQPRFEDLSELTLFADNLVPHVLRLDGVLEFTPTLIERIESEQLVEHGSAEEVEIRACSVHTVELLTHEMGRMRRGSPPAAATVDQVLWNRGQGMTYKSRPRMRTRCTGY